MYIETSGWPLLAWKIPYKSGCICVSHSMRLLEVINRVLLKLVASNTRDWIMICDTFYSAAATAVRSLETIVDIFFLSS